MSSMNIISLRILFISMSNDVQLGINWISRPLTHIFIAKQCSWYTLMYFLWKWNFCRITPMKWCKHFHSVSLKFNGNIAKFYLINKLFLDRYKTNDTIHILRQKWINIVRCCARVAKAKYKWCAIILLLCASPTYTFIVLYVNSSHTHLSKAVKCRNTERIVNITKLCWSIPINDVLVHG